nr:M48 family metalloprotease [Novosphingobium sp. TH158]
MVLVPSVGGSQSTQSISQSDKEQGAKAHPQLLQEFGGAMTGPQASYVEGVGKAIAVQSGLSNAQSDFTVTLLNSSVNNAFAIPGGYVYVTRDLVGLMNNEAELAGVLGHEVGHVAAQHGKKRQSTATRNSIFGVLGQVLGAAVGGQFGGLLSRGAQVAPQLLTLKYSRGQETEADNLGIAYLRRAGYDGRAMGSVLQSLANENALEARIQGQTGNKVPEWASTHPSDAPRIRAALARAGAASGNLNRDKFLAGINGLMIGDDPKQGIIDGRRFLHPDMKFGFEVPQGFYMVNGTQAVAITGQSAKGELSSAAYNGNMDAYIQSVFARLAGQGQAINPGAIQRTRVNDLPAAYAAARVNTSSGQVDVLVFAYEFSNNQAFHFLTITQPGGANAFESMFKSMRRLSAGEAAGVKPRRISVVTVKKGDTVQTMATRMAYADHELDRFLVLNGLTSTSPLVPGQKVKLIVY